MFKTHAPNSAHRAIHVTCVPIALDLQSVQPDRAGKRVSVWEQKWASIGAKMCRKHCTISRLHRFRFFSDDITPTVYWLDYRKLNLSVSFREEVNWSWNYWKWRVKMSGHWGKYGTDNGHVYIDQGLYAIYLVEFAFAACMLINHDHWYFDNNNK